MGSSSARTVDTSVEHLSVAAMVIDTLGRVVLWNRRAEALYGWAAAEVLGRNAGELLVPPGEVDAAGAVQAQVVQGQQWEGTLRVLRKDGGTFLASVRDIPLVDDEGTTTAVLRLSADVTDWTATWPSAEPADEADRVAASRLARLQAITTSLSGAATVEEVGDLLVGDMAAELRARSASLWLVDEASASLRLARHAGLMEDAAERFAQIPLDADLPGPDVVRTLIPALIPTRADRDRRWPALASVPTDVEGVAVVPLATSGRALGCIAFGFPDRRDFPSDECSYLLAIADQCAIAIDRARLLDSERQARERLTVVADAAALLSSSLDRWEILNRLTALTVPRLADGCAVYVPESGSLRRVASAQGEARGVDTLAHEPSPGPDADTPTARAYRTGTVQEICAGAPRGSDTTSGLAVPMRARGRVVGVMTLEFSDRSRVDDMGLRAMVEDLAARAAMALDNALLYEHQHRVAEALQRAIMPGALPRLPGHEIVGRYVPSGEIGFVGGDWWDVFHLPGDRFALIIGDVAGHDANAASAMAVVRNALRAYAFESDGPGEALTRLNRLLLARRWEPLASALYAEYDPATGTVEWASAGHPAPVLVRSDGTAGFLDSLAQPVLAVLPHEYAQTGVTLEPGSLLLLYSDGLVEGRRHGIEEGQQRLLDVVAEIAGQRVDTVCRVLLESLVSDDNEDDVSLLALGRTS